MMESSYRRKRRPVAEINLVPYIDVMLVLLIIFMITAPTLQQGIEVRLPQVEASAVETKSELPLVAVIDAKGQYFLEYPNKISAPLNIVKIKNKIADYLEDHPRAQVLIKADTDIHYGQVVSLMADLQALGLDSIGLITEQPQ